MMPLAQGHRWRRTIARRIFAIPRPRHPRVVFSLALVAALGLAFPHAQVASSGAPLAQRQSLATDSPPASVAIAAADWPTTTTTVDFDTTTSAAPTTSTVMPTTTVKPIVKSSDAPTAGTPAPAKPPTNTSAGGGAPAGQAGSTASAADGTDGNAWKLTASEDFANSSALGQWGLYDGGGTFGAGTRRPSMISVSDGLLHIAGKNQVTGGMAQHLSQTYGRWTFRAKMDRGKGYAPAILLWPDSERWPQDGEIDIVELEDANRTSASSTLHFGADNKQEAHAVSGDFTQWHTFAVDWMPDHVTFYVDGKAHFTSRNSAAIPKTKMHLAIQLDTGKCGASWIGCPDGTTPADVALHVDWVKVYRPA